MKRAELFAKVSSRYKGVQLDAASDLQKLTEQAVSVSQYSG